MAKTLAEASKNWSKAELREALLEFHEHYKAFETFLIEELGRETYMDLCNEFALRRSQNMLRSWGMPEEDVEKFADYIGQKKKDVEA